VYYYLLECIIEKGENFIIEGVGIYSSEKKAEYFRAMCEKELTDEERECIMFEYREIELNQEPEFVMSQQEHLDIVSESLTEMVKEDLLDQLVGEDGDFYYRITEKGKELGISFPDGESEDN